MSVVFNPFTGKFDFTGGSTSSTASIPQYSTDPVSPTAEDAWVLATSGGGGSYNLQGFIGGFPLVDYGSGGATTYQFSYYTNEGTIIRTALS